MARVNRLRKDLECTKANQKSVVVVVGETGKNIQGQQLDNGKELVLSGRSGNMAGECRLVDLLCGVSVLCHALVKSSFCLSASVSIIILSPSLNFSSRMCMASWS